LLVAVWWRFWCPAGLHQSREVQNS